MGYLRSTLAEGFKGKFDAAAGSIPFLIFMLEQSQSISHPRVGEGGVVVTRGHIDQVPAVLTMVYQKTGNG